MHVIAYQITERSRYPFSVFDVILYLSKIYNTADTIVAHFNVSCRLCIAGG